MKHCNQCNTDKELSDFGKRTASHDGLAPLCKSCQSRKDRERNDDPRRKAMRERYAKTSQGKARGNAGKAAWSARNRVKKAAAIIVNNAVRDGRLFKPEHCEECGVKPSRLHGHHDDYAFALQVRWLCPACHTAWHKEHGAGINA